MKKLWAICILTLISQVASAQVKQCTNNLARTSFAWDHTGTVNYFVIKWGNRPVQNIGLPPQVHGSYIVPIPTNLIVGDHDVQIRACVTTTPNVCSPFVKLAFAYHP